MTALCVTAMNYDAVDRAYIDAHRFLYGDLGEHVATAGILFRDRLMRPGFVLPVIRLAPVAPYGHCMERSRSIRVGGRTTTGTPPGCLSYADLTRWPHPVLNEGPPLRARVLAEAPLCATATSYSEADDAA